MFWTQQSRQSRVFREQFGTALKSVNCAWMTAHVLCSKNYRNLLRSALHVLVGRRDMRVIEYLALCVGRRARDGPIRQGRLFAARRSARSVESVREAMMFRIQTPHLYA